MELQENIDTTTPNEESAWYIDLTAEEYAAYCLQMAKMRGPMRHRNLLMAVAVVMAVVMVSVAVVEWWFFHLPFDWITAACGVLMLIPIGIWAMMPYFTYRKAVARHKNSLAAGMVFTGQLIVTPEYIEKVGPSATAHIALDNHALFFENKQMMVFQTNGSPALIIPGRCLTADMAAQIRHAADALPPRNRRFIARVRCGGEVVAPVDAQKPQQVWTNTFTYTPDEFATVMRSAVTRRFWKLAPWITIMASLASFTVGWDGIQTMTTCIVYFLMFMGVFLLLNWIMPMKRIKAGADQISAHDRTLKITFDTVALRVESPKGASNWVLWSDVTHVYDRGEFAEVVMGKHAVLYIPKRAIEDIPAFEMALDHCRGKK